VTLRIALAKPDFGITGGFEFLMREVARALVDRGHEVVWLCPKTSDLVRPPFGLPAGLSNEAVPEYIQFLRLLDEFRGLDLHRADLVISSQPPSYGVCHDRQLSIFSHHQRRYYDLSEVLIEAGLIRNVEAHHIAVSHLHAIDNQILPNVNRILATSEEVQGRLKRFNGLESNVGVFHAGLGFRPSAPELTGGEEYENVLCVSRHEFPKRTELFVHAMNLLPQVDGIAVGAGGRLGYVMDLDRRFADATLDPDTESRSLWCVDARLVAPGPVPGRPGRVHFTGQIADEELDLLYRRAVCVVAPAFLEDYGLTAVEAMSFGKPLVVCRDGGNLVNFVCDGENGFVVEPSGQAIAEAVRELASDPTRARAMGAAARETARSFTWDRGMQEIEESIEMVMSS
jgi:glycosyltransferase involved in cell wall biosynthesis